MNRFLFFGVWVWVVAQNTASATMIEEGLKEVMIAESIPSNMVSGFKNPKISFQTESEETKHHAEVVEYSKDLSIPSLLVDVAIPSRVSEKPYSFTINKTKVILVNGGTQRN